MAWIHALLTLVLVASTSAFFFGRGTPVAVSDGRAVENSCLKLADQGSCDFYTCFEHRLPCGREWYMLRSGHYYCKKIQREKSRFTPEGQTFLDNAQRCLTQSLKELYRAEHVDCHDLEHRAIEAITPCFTDNGFCDVLQANTRNFIQVYEVSDLFAQGASKVWRQIATLAAHCGGKAAREFSSNTGDTVINAINGFFRSLANRVSK